MPDAGEPRVGRGGGVGEGPLLLIVGLAGAATMVVELGAVRVLAPWYGASSSVWTNVIGVVLAALALGYALGARLAAGPRPQRRLGVVLVMASLFSASLLLAARPVADLLMPAGVPLHRAAGVLVWGSLACATVLFLPAATALGCAGPLAVESLQRHRGGAAARPAGASSPPRPSEVSSGRSGPHTGPFRPWGSPPPTCSPHSRCSGPAPF